MATESTPIKSAQGPVMTANDAPAIPPKGEPEHEKKAAPAEPAKAEPAGK